MQVINLDLSVKGIIPLLQAKQGDVGRKFQAVITDGGTAYDIPSGTTLSVWYSGTSGEGNYSHIGLDDDFLQSRSAFTISGNTVTVELVAQMLACAGGGTLSLVMNGADGTQIATWNIPYFVEKIPGANSEGATQYYTAFSKAVTEMSSALVRALEDAKASGEFDGPRGNPGADGYTPVKGVDYFTDADKNELTAGLSQVETPKIVSSVAEMTDTQKHYVLASTGTIWACRTYTKEGEIVLVPNFTNLIKFDANGNPTNVALNQRYSGSAGLANNYLSSQNGSFAITDMAPNDDSTPTFYINRKPVGQSKLAWFVSEAAEVNGVGTINATDWASGENGEYKYSATSGQSYVKFSAQMSTSAITADDLKDLIVTLNEPITYTEQKTEGETVSEWYDTGISYAPTFKTDLVGVLGEGNVIYLSENLPSGTYTLKYGDETYQTIGTLTV